MYSSEKEWKILEPYFAPKKTGRPRKHNIRTIINETRYVMRTGCQWKQLPKDFPRWKTVYSFNSRLKNSGKWQEIHDALGSVNKIMLEEKSRKKKKKEVVY